MFCIIDPAGSTVRSNGVCDVTESLEEDWVRNGGAILAALAVAVDVGVPKGGGGMPLDSQIVVALCRGVRPLMSLSSTACVYAL